MHVRGELTRLMYSGHRVGLGRDWSIQELRGVHSLLLPILGIITFTWAPGGSCVQMI